MTKKFIRIRKKILAFAASVIAFTAVTSGIPITAHADGQDMTYDDNYGAMTGYFTTEGQITRIEVFYSAEYSNGKISIFQKGDVRETILSDIAKGEDVSISDDVEIIGGGTIEILDYNMLCSSYYFVQKDTNAINWTIRVNRTSSLGECFVVRATVPAGWKNAATSTTEPEEFLCGFIDSSISSHTADDIVPIISTIVQSDDEQETPTEFVELPATPEKTKDPFTALLKVLIFIVVVAIIVTYILYERTKRTHSKEASEKRLKKANAKFEEKKKKEDASLLEIMDTYSNEYRDDIYDDDDDVDDDIYDDYEEKPNVEEDYLAEKAVKEKPVSKPKNMTAKKPALNHTTESKAKPAVTAPKEPAAPIKTQSVKQKPQQNVQNKPKTTKKKALPAFME